MRTSVELNMVNRTFPSMIDSAPLCLPAEKGDPAREDGVERSSVMEVGYFAGQEIAIGDSENNRRISQVVA